MMQKKLIIIIITTIFFVINVWILFLMWKMWNSYRKQIIFEGNLKCQEFANQYPNPNKSKYIHYGGVFYSPKFHSCMEYYRDINRDSFIKPIFAPVTNNQLWYYAWVCPPDPQDCYYVYNKTFWDMEKLLWFREEWKIKIETKYRKLWDNPWFETWLYDVLPMVEILQK